MKKKTASYAKPSIMEVLNKTTREQRSFGNRVGIIGTSLVQHNNTGNASFKMTTWSKGWWNWVETLYPNMAISPNWYDPTVRAGWEPDGPGTNSTVYFRGLNAGIGGALLPEINSRKEYLVEDVDCDIIIFDGGTNDVSVSTKEEILEMRNEIIQYYLDNGKVVIVLPILSRGTTAWTTVSGYRQKANWINNKTKDFVRNKDRCYIFDWNEYWVDFNSASGTPKAGYSIDETHFTTLGAYAVGKALGAFISKLLPEGHKNISSPDDLYDATANPNGNLLTNPTLTGTTGTTSAPVTGSTATGFRTLRNTSIGTACAASKEARADGRGTYQVLTFTPSQSAGSELFYFQTSTTSISHNLPVGTWVRASVEVDVGAWAGWQGVSMYLRDGATGGIIAYGMEDYSADAWPSEAWKGIIQTPAFQIVDAASTLQWRVQVKVNNAIAGPGVLKIGCAELRPVESPKEIVNYTE